MKTRMTNKPSLATFMLVLCLAGCAQHQTMYQWGDYDTLLYRSYKEPDKTVVLQRRLEAHITQLEQSQLKVAPGLYAELGTLYLQTGDAAKATA
ncbi:MAG: hypothetical protein JWQ16_287, partial [Novosphingobium sp.]|nr:hypothetical protein [Novosphingobium sp.]